MSKIKSILLLIIFVWLNIGVAHAISHDDTIECDHCIIIIDSNNTKAYDDPPHHQTNLTCFIEYSQKPTTSLYKRSVTRNRYSSQFFNRPPPRLISIAIRRTFRFFRAFQIKKWHRV